MAIRLGQTERTIERLTQRGIGTSGLARRAVGQQNIEALTSVQGGIAKSLAILEQQNKEQLAEVKVFEEKNIGVIKKSISINAARAAARRAAFARARQDAARKLARSKRFLPFKGRQVRDINNQLVKADSPEGRIAQQQDFERLVKGEAEDSLDLEARLRLSSFRLQQKFDVTNRGIRSLKAPSITKPKEKAQARKQKSVSDITNRVRKNQSITKEETDSLTKATLAKMSDPRFNDQPMKDFFRAAQEIGLSQEVALEIAKAGGIF